MARLYQNARQAKMPFAFSKKGLVEENENQANQENIRRRN